MYQRLRPWFHHNIVFLRVQAFVPLTNAPVALTTGDELKFRCKFDTTKETAGVDVCIIVRREGAML
jgi:hypothetical protein